MQHYVYHSGKSLGRQLSRAGFEVLATSKAFMGKGPFAALRYCALTVWQAFAVALGLQREVLCIARKR